MLTATAAQSTDVLASLCLFAGAGAVLAAFAYTLMMSGEPGADGDSAKDVTIQLVVIGFIGGIIGAALAIALMYASVPLLT